MKHSPECDAAQEKWRVEVADYLAKWPNRCPECRGWGGATYRYDPSPAGVALSPGTMVDFEPCPACVGRGKCPRCSASAHYEYQDGPCPTCGWKDGDKGEPEQPECCCGWDDDMGVE